MPAGGQQTGGTVLAKHGKLYSFSEKSIFPVSLMDRKLELLSRNRL